MKSWMITLAATVVVLIVASAYDWNGRNADDVQKMAVRLHESSRSEREYCSRQLEHWVPDDGLAVLFAYYPVGYLLAGGLAISFVVLAGTQGNRDLPLFVFSAIGVIGCAATVFGHEVR